MFDSFHDKDIEISGISVHDDKLLVLLSNGAFMIGKIKTENNKNNVKLSL